MTVAEVIKITYNAGFRGAALVTAVAIAIAESGLKPDAIGDTILTNNKWGESIGLFQIRSLQMPYLYLEPIRNYNLLFNPDYNAKAAFAISKNGTDFTPWSTYKDGSHTKYIAQVADVAKTIYAVVATHKTESTVVAAVAVAAIIYFATR